MKHLVRIQPTPQAARELEARPGGPGPIVARIIERFKPEAVYMSPSQRSIFLVCDLDPCAMAELMVAGARYAGQNPEFTAVISGNEFGAIVGKVLPAALKLIDG